MKKNVFLFLFLLMIPFTAHAEDAVVQAPVIPAVNLPKPAEAPPGLHPKNLLPPEKTASRPKMPAFAKDPTAVPGTGKSAGPAVVGPETDQIARLQKQIDELRAEIAALKASVAAVKK